MNKKLLMVLILGIFFFSLASAQDLVYPAEETLNVTVTCLNNGYCSASAICNINIIDPLGDLIVQGENMTNDISVHYYELLPNKTGTYTVNGYCQDGSLTKGIDFNFEITPSGKTSNSGESLIYFVLLLMFSFLIAGLFYLISVLPMKNSKDDENKLFNINILKYLKVGLIGISYGLIVIFLNLLNAVAENFTTATMFTGIVGFLFTMLLNWAWVWTTIIVIWVVVLIIKDTNWKSWLTERGYVNG